mmetsp:Transcript_6640/g.27080  ORF Transcript_6640/g.27080 Transcript_6640/m.27080 type:complete len:338 (-) Transcript_6640:349-1362(-)
MSASVAGLMIWAIADGWVCADGIEFTSTCTGRPGRRARARSAKLWPWDREVGTDGLRRATIVVVVGGCVGGALAGAGGRSPSCLDAPSLLIRRGMGLLAPGDGETTPPVVRAHEVSSAESGEGCSCSMCSCCCCGVCCCWRWYCRLPTDETKWGLTDGDALRKSPPLGYRAAPALVAPAAVLASGGAMGTPVAPPRTAPASVEGKMLDALRTTTLLPPSRLSMVCVHPLRVSGWAACWRPAPRGLRAPPPAARRCRLSPAAAVAEASRTVGTACAAESLMAGGAAIMPSASGSGVRLMMRSVGGSWVCVPSYCVVTVPSIASTSTCFRTLQPLWVHL